MSVLSRYIMNFGKQSHLARFEKLRSFDSTLLIENSCCRSNKNNDIKVLDKINYKLLFTTNKYTTEQFSEVL